MNCSTIAAVFFCCAVGKRFYWRFSLPNSGNRFKSLFSIRLLVIGLMPYVFQKELKAWKVSGRFHGQTESIFGLVVSVSLLYLWADRCESTDVCSIETVLFNLLLHLHWHDHDIFFYIEMWLLTKYSRSFYSHFLNSHYTLICWRIKTHEFLKNWSNFLRIL